MEENSYLKDKFRADVFKEIEEYIGKNKRQAHPIFG